MHIASAFGHEAVVTLLLDHGANLEAVDNVRHQRQQRLPQDGATPLQAACANGQDALAQLLLDRVANVDAAIKVHCEAHATLAEWLNSPSQGKQERPRGCGAAAAATRSEHREEG